MNSNNNAMDKIIDLDNVFDCNLDCGLAGGKCIMERSDDQGGAIKKRCLCPLGYAGEKCAFGKLATWPLFTFSFENPAGAMFVQTF